MLGDGYQFQKLTFLRKAANNATFCKKYSCKNVVELTSRNK